MSHEKAASPLRALTAFLELNLAYGRMSLFPGLAYLMFSSPPFSIFSAISLSASSVSCSIVLPSVFFGSCFGSPAGGKFVAAARLLLSLLSPNMQGPRPFEKNEQYGRFSRTTVWAIAGAVVLVLFGFLFISSGRYTHEKSAENPLITVP